jgi:hypothetical protein
MAILNSCSSDLSTDKEEHTESGNQRNISTETQEMVKLLEEIAQDLTPFAAPYLSSQRVEYFRNIEKTESSDQDIQLKYRLASDLLSSGKTDEAIQEFQLLLQLMNQNGDNVNPKTEELVHELLALSYFRNGQQVNCLNNHKKESCLVPIVEGGEHENESGSREAIKVYLSILNEYPDDQDSRWLLNVAYMTLGEYPEKVPQKWLIPVKAFESDYKLKRFHDIAPDLGINVNSLAGGSIIEDFDGDGNLDIIASSWGIRDQIRYFNNNGDGTFTDFTIDAGLKGIVSGLNMIHADYDNDGDPDVFVLRGAWLSEHGAHPNSLLRNNGDGTFTDVTKKSGLLSFHPTQTGSWGDFDNDGWLDLFIGNETRGTSIHPCELYKNKGDGTFENVANEMRLDVKTFVKGAVWGDYNNDGFLDLYLSCIMGSNLLFKNNGTPSSGSWSFTNVSKKAGVEEPMNSFPTWFWDYNNDGWLDIFVSGFSVDRAGSVASDVVVDYLGQQNKAERPRLYKNNGNGTFMDVSKDVNLDKALYTMGSNFGDLDNDGYLDFYLGTGEPDLRALVPNRMFRNAEGKSFQDVTTSGGFGHIQKGHGISFGDIDNDGDQDIYAVMGGANEVDIFHNVMFENPGTENHWLTIILEGVESNKDAIGSRIRIDVETSKGSTSIYSTVSTGGSFGSSSLRQEIGLGNATAIDRIEVTWPKSGKKQVFENIEMDQAIRIVEGESKVIPFNLNVFNF